MKSQVSIEFLVGVAFLLLVYIVSLTGFSNFTQSQLIKGESGKETCYTVAGAINSASSAGDGFSMNVTLPYYINTEHDFLFIVLNASTVNINWSTGFFACSLVTQNVTNLKMNAGKFSLNNINGTVYVSSVNTGKLVYNTSEQVPINGSYFINNALLNFYKNGASVLGIGVITNSTTHSFSYNFTTSGAGHYKVTANDINITTFYAEREFDVI